MISQPCEDPDGRGAQSISPLTRRTITVQNVCLLADTPSRQVAALRAFIHCRDSDAATSRFCFLTLSDEGKRALVFKAPYALLPTWRDYTWRREANQYYHPSRHDAAPYAKKARQVVAPKDFFLPRPASSSAPFRTKVGDPEALIVQLTGRYTLPCPRRSFCQGGARPHPVVLAGAAEFLPVSDVVYLLTALESAKLRQLPVPGGGAQTGHVCAQRTRRRRCGAQGRVWASVSATGGEHDFTRSRLESASISAVPSL